MIAAACGFISKAVVDRTIETHKSSLSVELERQKGKLSEELERLKGDLSKDVESHKLTLRKAEILYERQLEAASAFLPLSHKIRPQYSRPEMDWHDACEDTAQRLGHIERDLSAFQNAYGAVISPNARELISSAITLSAQNKFEGDVIEPSSHAADAAGRLLETISKIESLLIADIRG